MLLEDKNLCGALNNIQVATGHRVKTTRINRNLHLRSPINLCDKELAAYFRIYSLWNGYNPPIRRAIPFQGAVP